MKILMDLRKYDGVVGGVEQGALQITKNAAARGYRVVLVCKEGKLPQVREIIGGTNGVEIVPVAVPSHAISLRNMRVDSRFLQDLAVREGADLIHFFYNWSFPFRKRVPCVLTVHDVIPFTFREAMGLLRNRLLYRPLMRLACRLNDLIVTVSEFSRQDISRKIRVPLEKIRVVPNGLRDPAEPDPEVEADLERRFQLGSGYVLNVGGIHERKNIPRLIRAFAEVVKREGYGGKLVITGSVSGPPYQEKMKKLCDAAVAESKMDGKVTFTGFISDHELDVLLRRADVFVYPSLYEGFGIPILEAMKAGTPVITSNLTAMPEVAGDAALLVDPHRVEDIASAMIRLLRDQELRERLIRAGRERAGGYSWDRNYEEYLKVYEEVTGEAKARPPAEPVA